VTLVSRVKAAVALASWSRKTLVAVGERENTFQRKDIEQLHAVTRRPWELHYTIQSLPRGRRGRSWVGRLIRCVSRHFRLLKWLIKVMGKPAFLGQTAVLSSETPSLCA
jgi:hypothetical protein